VHKQVRSEQECQGMQSQPIYAWSAAQASIAAKSDASLTDQPVRDPAKLE
jgi:hypothetical protein